MPEVKFGKKNEPSTVFKKSDDLLAVRTRSKRSLQRGPVLSAAAAEVVDGELVMSFPEAGVEIFRVPTGAAYRSLDDRKKALRAAPDVRFAGGVLVDEKSGEPVVYTENLFVKFVDDAEPEECREVLLQAGLTIKDEPGYAANAFFVSAPEGIGEKVFEIAATLLKRSDVEFCHPEIVRRRGRRAVFPQQWHLKASTINGVPINASANVEAAHASARGEGIVIAVIDDGVDIDHAEFAGSGKIVAPRDATFAESHPKAFDPRPKDPSIRFPDDHGTACAGVAAANGTVGASGVAPKAKLMPIRLAANLGSQQEGNAFKWAVDHGADVVSCSWGPPDGFWADPNDPLHNQVTPLPASTRLAIDFATQNGRGGKGCIVLFAAGNGNESVDNDGYASYERVIAVAACNDRGKRSAYSDFGKAVWCSFPSNDFGNPRTGHPEPLTPGIWTTDRSGASGYNDGDPSKGDSGGDFANDFGGTSSACPGAAGVAALVLSVNPSLGREEVRDILKRCCDKIDPIAGAYDANGHSKLYGFGRLNAATAVALAKPQPTNSVIVSRTFNQPLPDLRTTAVSLEVGDSATLEKLAVRIDLLHTFIGDLIITLIPPASSGASKVVIHNRTGGATKNIKKTYDPTSLPALAGFKGKNPKGQWRLEIKDEAARDEGTLTLFGLELTFAPPTPPSRTATADNGATASATKPRPKAKTGKK